MRRLLLVISGLASLTMGILLAAPSAWADKPPAELGSGGYVLLIRHSITDTTRPDQPAIDLNNCGTQRNLSDEGRDVAQGIGAGIRKLNIPIGQVLAGPFCRASETARLAFGRAELSDTLLEANYAPIPGAATPPPVAERLEILRKMLGTPPPPGTNNVLVTHSGVIARALALRLEEGETLLFKPDGQGGAQFVGYVLASEWSSPGSSTQLPSTPAQLPRAGGGDMPWSAPMATLLGALLLAAGLRLRPAKG